MDVPNLGAEARGFNDIPQGALWTPNGGWSYAGERECAKAVEEYDSDLALGQRKDTGEWVVFIRNGPHDGEPFPVLGLGFRLPGADEVKKKLHTHDVRRHGKQLVADIERRKEAKRKELDQMRDENHSIAAERMEYTMRKLGNSTPNTGRIFVPRGV